MKLRVLTSNTWADSLEADKEKKNKLIKKNRIDDRCLYHTYESNKF